MEHTFENIFPLDEGLIRLSMTSNKTMFPVPIQLRYRDMDMNHHVNNAVYFTCMENARTEVLLEEMTKHHEEGYQLVVSEASCKYKRPIKLTHEIVCDVSFVPVRATSFDISYAFRNVETGYIHA